MPTSSNGGTYVNATRHPLFNRSFDTASASQNTAAVSDCSNEADQDHRNRPTVPYVNERREYDPQQPQTFLLYHQPRHDDDTGMTYLQQHSQRNEVPERVAATQHYLMEKHLWTGVPPRPPICHQQQQHPHGRRTAQIPSNELPVSSKQSGRTKLLIPNARVLDYYISHKKGLDAQSNDGHATPTVSHTTSTSSFFHPEDAHMDRPFDEFSGSNKNSVSEVDSLEEMLQQQDSFTTATGDDRYGEATTLSAIQEHPSLEAGSMSFSFTQPTHPPVDPGVKSTESNSDDSKTQMRPQPENQEIEQHQEAVSSGQPDYHPDENALQATEDHQVSRTHVPPEPLESFEPFEPFDPFQIQRQAFRPSSTKRFFTEMMATTARSSSADFGTASTLTPSEAPSSSSSLVPSETARREAEKLIQNFNKPSRRSRGDSGSHYSRQAKHDKTASTIASESTTAEDTQTFNSEDQDLTLHDLCGESSCQDDIAWRNALHVLSGQPQLASVRDAAGWTPLHIACLGTAPPPPFMTRSLLYVYPEAARRIDGGGRLPLHLVAASSADIETMKMLLQEYPQSIHHTDFQGWTPLHLLLKNFGVDVTLEHCRVLLGVKETFDVETTKLPRILLRREQHLSLPVNELDRVLPQPTPTTRLTLDEMHEQAFQAYPDDVQNAFRRLCQWKRKQRRIRNRTQLQQLDDEENAELDILASAVLDSPATNPAAQFTPINRQLPIHIIVRRGLAESHNQRFFSEGGYSDEDESDPDREEPTSDSSLAPRFLELCRLFIAFYPEGLVARDFQGHTPLLAALLTSNRFPSIEVIELLLGKRTSGYKNLPTWAREMPLYSLSSDRYIINPGMIPCKLRQQLPLHVIAEEMPGDFQMLSSVHEAYPGAVNVQDSRGRTPLHVLLRNYRRDNLNPSAIALLLSDTVAQARDDANKLPFDLLTDTAGKIDAENSHFKVSDETFEDHASSFVMFFQGTIIASTKPGARKHLQPDDFLWRLRVLPPWFRRQACMASFVQELVVEELASRKTCALILLYAALLFALIMAFRLQVHYFINIPEAQIPFWTTLAVLLCAFGLFLYQLVFWSVCISMSDFLNQCVFNLWRWMDLVAIVSVSSTTTMLYYGSFSDEAVLKTAAVATGTLWFSFIGFLSSWFYGAALFSAAVQRIASLMFWPLLVALVLSLCFAQMVYTMAQMDCKLDGGTGDWGFCDVRESYVFLYYLVIGEPVVYIDDGQSRLPQGIGFLAVMFLVAAFLVILSVLSMVVLVGSQWDIDSLALRSFWEPKLTFVISASRPGYSTTFAKTGRSATALESLWDICSHILLGRNAVKGTYWYACFASKPAPVKALYWLITAVMIPLWLMLGLLTLGVLWPPQIRRFLFRPSFLSTYAQHRPFRSGRNQSSTPAEHYAAQMSKMRQELSRIRDMSFERSNDVQREVRELKELLLLATTD